MIIHTRQNKEGTYWCNATLNGYDYSFEGDTAELARSQMKSQLRKIMINPDNVKWDAVEIYTGTVEKRTTIYKRPWLDFLR